MSSFFFLGILVVECIVLPSGRRTAAAPVGAKFITAPLSEKSLLVIRVIALMMNVLPTPAVPCTIRRISVFSCPNVPFLYVTKA